MSSVTPPRALVAHWLTVYASPMDGEHEGGTGGGGWENAVSTKLLATHCAICGRPLRDPESIERGIGPDCNEKLGRPNMMPTGVDPAGVARALAMAPAVLREAWERIGGAADESDAAWRVSPETRRQMLSIGLHYGALAVSFGPAEASVVRGRVDSAKQCIAAVQGFAQAAGYDAVADRMREKYIEKLEGNLIVFRRSKREGFLGVHTPFSDQWRTWCNANSKFFVHKEYIGKLFFRYFDEKKLGFIANALTGIFGDTLIIDPDGNMVALPTMHIEPEEKIAPAAPTPPVEDMPATGEVEKYSVPDSIKLGDLFKLDDGRELPIQYIDPKRGFIGVGTSGKGKYVFFSFAQVKALTGREVAKDMYTEAVRLADQAKEPAPPRLPPRAVARALPINCHGQSLMEHQVTGVQFVDERYGRALIADEMGLGKGLVYGTRVLTPSGWVAIETLRVGDVVTDPDGGTAQVTGSFPQPKQPVFEVTFSDDVRVKTDAAHLWHVYSVNDRFRKNGGRVMSTAELAAAGLRTRPSKSGWTNRKWYLPVMEAAELQRSEGDRTWPAYAMGVLLGDGSFGLTVRWSKPDEEIVTRMEALVSVGRRAVAVGGRCPEFAVYDGAPVAKRLGLFKIPSESKFIPSHYLTDSVAERIELLRGLMDTDGDCTKEGTSIFNTSSPRLRDDVIELVRSLGGIATMYTKEDPKYSYKGEIRTGLTAYRVNVRVPFNPFHLTRKAKRWKKPILARTIESIEPAGEAETICIRVSSKRSLYVAEGHVVTHNTAMSGVTIDAPAVIVCPALLKVNWLRELQCWRPDLSVAIISGSEMPTEDQRKADVVIINYDILPHHVEELGWVTQRNNVTVIADEAQYLKNLEIRWDKETGRIEVVMAVRKAQPMTGLILRPLNPDDEIPELDEARAEDGGYALVYKPDYKGENGRYLAPLPGVKVKGRTKRVALYVLGHTTNGLPVASVKPEYEDTFRSTDQVILRGGGKNIPVEIQGTKYRVPPLPERKVPKVARAAAFYELWRDVPRVLLLTGTPIMNRVRELFPLIHLIDPRTWNNGFKFCERYCGGHYEQMGPKQIYKCDGRTNSEELHRLVNNVIMLRRTADVLNLPEKRRGSMSVSLSGPAAQKYDRQVREFLKWVEDSGGPKAVSRAKRAEAIVKMTRLRETAAEGKVPATLNWIEDHWISTARPLVVMGTNRTAFEMLAKGIDALNARHDEQVAAGDAPDMQAPIRYSSVLGGMSERERQAAIDGFQGAPGVEPVFDLIFYSVALATGTTLTRAQDMVFFERAWRPGDLAQAEARIYRKGQKNQCMITYIDAEGTIDGKIAMLLQNKIEAASAVIEGVNLTEEQASELVFGELFNLAGMQKNPPADIEDLVSDSWGSPLPY